MLPILCVDVLVVYSEACLLLKRKNQPAKNHWWFPGGRLHKNESIKNAAHRKCKEEVNLSAKFIGIISIEETIFPKVNSMNCDIHTVNICCQMNVEDISCISIDANHADYLWTDASQACALNLHSAVLEPILKVLR